MNIAQAKDVAAAAGKKPSKGICGGNTEDVHDPKNAPSTLPESLENESGESDIPVPFPVDDPQELKENHPESDLDSPPKSRPTSHQDRITRSILFLVSIYFHRSDQ